MDPAKLALVAEHSVKAQESVFNAELTTRDQLVALRLAALAIAAAEPEEPDVLASSDAAALAIREAGAE